VEAMAGLSAHPLISLHALDVTSDADVLRVVELIVAEAGHIDIVVNNAGMIAIGPLIEQPLEHVHTAFDTNTYGALRVARAVFPHMATRRSGLIINIGSVVGDIAVPWNGLYSATKAAMHMMSNILMMELSPFNIRVMNIAPGSVRSNIASNATGFSLSSTSRYTDFLPDMVRRMNSSQTRNAMPADQFARKVVGAALSRNPPTHMTVGGSAWVYKLLRWLPHTFVLWFSWRLFSKKA